AGNDVIGRSPLAHVGDLVALGVEREEREVVEEIAARAAEDHFLLPPEPVDEPGLAAVRAERERRDATLDRLLAAVDDDAAPGTRGRDVGGPLQVWTEDDLLDLVELLARVAVHHGEDAILPAGDVGAALERRAERELADAVIVGSAHAVHDDELAAPGAG